MCRCEYLSPLPPSSSCWCCSTCRWLLPGAGLKTCRRPAELQRGGDLKGHVEISCGKIRLIDMNLDLWSAAHNVLSASLVDTAVDDNVHRNAFSSGGWVDCCLSKKINGSGSESEGEKLKDGTRRQRRLLIFLPVSEIGSRQEAVEIEADLRPGGWTLCTRRRLNEG